MLSLRALSLASLPTPLGYDIRMRAACVMLGLSACGRVGFDEFLDASLALPDAGIGAAQCAPLPMTTGTLVRTVPELTAAITAADHESPAHCFYRPCHCGERLRRR
jgi:hypothetical protein